MWGLSENDHLFVFHGIVVIHTTIIRVDNSDFMHWSQFPTIWHKRRAELFLDGVDYLVSRLLQGSEKLLPSLSSNLIPSITK